MRIVSWNIQWGRGADGCVDLSRTIGVLRELDADVICLQEVAVGMSGLPGNVTEDGVQRLWKGLPEYAAFFGPAVDVGASDGGRAQFGNLILSRLPVGQVWRHLLPWPADPTVPSMQRGCVEIVVDHSSGPVRVLTTHLEYYSAGARLAQTERLASLRGSQACSRRPATLRRRRPKARKVTPHLRPGRARHARYFAATSIAARANRPIELFRMTCRAAPGETRGLH